MFVVSDAQSLQKGAAAMCGSSIEAAVVSKCGAVGDPHAIAGQMATVPISLTSIQL